MESDGGLRHLAFFEELGKMDDSDASWRAVSAGLVTMRLVDRWIAVGSTSRLDSWSVSAAREAIALVSDGTPIRRILTSVVDVMVACTATDMHALSPRLMAYGQALEYDAKWTLAADVYTTITSHTHPVDDADLAIASSLQLGFCLRTLGQLDDAASAYARASQLAAITNDVSGTLRGRLGDVKIAIARGNMPAAEAMLDETIEHAFESGLPNLQSRALSERAYVAGLRGEHHRALHFAHDALGLTSNPREKDRILTNIAAGFRHIGMLSVARDAYLVLAATAQEQYVRWWSSVNLMELAAAAGNELVFDRYRRELESAPFTPSLRFNYLLAVGQGYVALANANDAIPYFEQAIDVATVNQMNRQLFEAEAALGDAKRGRLKPAAAFVPETADDISDVIRSVEDMKVLAGI